jgi:hypothetical protein
MAPSEAAAPGAVGRKRSQLTVAVLVAAVVAVAWVTYNADTNVASDGIRQAGEPQAMRPTVIPIASASDVDIPAGAIERFSWEVPQNQPNCHLTGRIEVVAGGSKDVQVFVVSADEYQNLENGHSARTYFSTEKTTVVVLDVQVGGPGPKVLALGNTFSAFTAKRVHLSDVEASCT